MVRVGPKRLVAFIPLYTSALNDDDVQEIHGEMEKFLVLCSLVFRLNKHFAVPFEH